MQSLFFLSATLRSTHKTFNSFRKQNHEVCRMCTQNRRFSSNASEIEDRGVGIRFGFISSRVQCKLQKNVFTFYAFEPEVSNLNVCFWVSRVRRGIHPRIGVVYAKR